VLRVVAVGVRSAVVANLYEGRHFSTNKNKNPPPPHTLHTPKISRLLPPDLVKSLARFIRGGALSDAQELASRPLGKVFSTECPSSAGLRFPPTTCTTLDDEQLCVPLARPALLLLSFNQFGFDQLESWRLELDRRAARYVELSVSDTYASKWLRSSLLGGLESVVPVHRRSKVCLYTDSFAAQRKALDISNLASSYVYVLDGNGSVTHRACGVYDAPQDACIVQATSHSR
jgi:hypothetical protein